MKKKTLKRLAAVFSACTVVAASSAALPPVSVLAEDAAASGLENLIENSTFDNNTLGWSLYKESGGACSIAHNDGVLAFTVTNQGKLNYSCQLCYDIIPLYQNGVYRLSYDISSTVDRDVEFMIQKNGGDYRSYTWKALALTPEMTHYDYEFTMKEESDIMAKLCINCGLEGEVLDEHTIFIDNVVLELVDDSKVDYSSTKPYAPPIVTNQIGYKTNSKKTAVFRNITDEKEFSVVNAKTDEVVYTGTLSDPIENSAAGETNYIGDFTELTAAGSYYITCGDLDKSYKFSIGDDVYGSLIDDTIRMLYLQRCGTRVEHYDFGHIPCHDTPAVLYGTDEEIDVTGGWHDAGDYGRYIVPAAKTIADLFYGYQANPDLFGDDIGIPESGNGVPDVFDEARYELEWMLKMQDKESGGVHHKVSCESFPGYVMPQLETGQLIVTPVSTTATGDFCASMALAYEFYKPYDEDFANTCLAAAEKAWGFLEENPDLIFENPEDITTGDYGDKSDKDERYWAAAQMYRATGEQKYLDAFSGMKACSGLDWSTVGDYGNIALLTMTDASETAVSAVSKASDNIIKVADGFVENSAADPYGVSITSYNWGSNMTVANNGMILSLAYGITKDQKYLDAAEAQLNYLLGHNANGECFVTGCGTVSPECPHHRPSMVVGYAMPGMLVGGPNSKLEDSAAKAYCRGNAAAKCYVDNWESYSTNEITIYWNSPLTALLAMTDLKGTDDNDPVYGDADCDGAVTINDAVLVMSYASNSTETVISDQGLDNADVYARGDGVSSLDALSIQRLLANLISELPESASDAQELTENK